MLIIHDLLLDIPWWNISITSIWMVLLKLFGYYLFYLISWVIDCWFLNNCISFGNLTNLQYLCENGRIHKFANSICWPAFMIQEFHQEHLGSSVSDSQLVNLYDTECSPEVTPIEHQDRTESFNITQWNDYCIKISQALCSFLLAPEDLKFHKDQELVAQSSMPISPAYWELSTRWIIKVVFTVFPCIKACSSERKLPTHIRWFSYWDAMIWYFILN